MTDWLMFAGICVTSGATCISAYLSYLTKIQSNETKDVADSTHKMVNSKFEKLVKENAAMAARIAQLSGTRDDATRADVAQERVD